MANQLVKYLQTGLWRGIFLITSKHLEVLMYCDRSHRKLGSSYLPQCLTSHSKANVEADICKFHTSLIGSRIVVHCGLARHNPQFSSSALSI